MSPLRETRRFLWARLRCCLDMSEKVLLKNHQEVRSGNARLLLVMPNVVSYESFFIQLAERLHHEGMEVHVATCAADKQLVPPPREGQWRGAVQHQIAFARGANPLGHVTAARSLRQLVERIKPDIIHAHFDAAIFTVAMARRKSWPPALATFHGISFCLMRGIKRRLVRAAGAWAARHFQKVYVLQDENREMLQEASPVAEIEVWPGFGVGCDLKRFSPVSRWEREVLRAEFGLEPSQRVFLFVGRFIQSKGFEILARAFLQAAAADPKLYLMLVGCADPLHPTGLSAAEERALGTCPQVKIIGKRNDVERCLGAADVLVLPSRREGMPVCLMESLSMGVPAITSDVAGCRHVVRHGIDGLILRNLGVQELADAICQLAGDEVLLQKFRAAALAGRERFSRQAFVEEQWRVYREMLHGDARAHSKQASGIGACPDGQGEWR